MSNAKTEKETAIFTGWRELNEVMVILGSQKAVRLNAIQAINIGKAIAKLGEEAKNYKHRQDR